MRIITLFLTCSDTAEADKITDALLTAKLVACVKQSDIHSENYWQGKREKSNEILLMMESVEDNFDAIEQAVRELHSYETFVLTAYPVLKASHGVDVWMQEAVS